MMPIDLTKMQSGERGIVVEIQGGYGLVRKLAALGMRPGVEISKVSSQIMRGPVTVRIGNTQVAIGFGMARRVLVAVGD
jgi:ferrous iron transport protein A